MSMTSEFVEAIKTCTFNSHNEKVHAYAFIVMLEAAKGNCRGDSGIV